MISGEKESLRYLFRNRKVKGLCKFLFDIDLTPKQEEIVRTIAFGEHKRVVIACMTRYGKSYSVSLGLLLWILGHLLLSLQRLLFSEYLDIKINDL